MLKVVIALNAAWNIVNFRSGLIRALVAAGYEVVAVAPHDEYAYRLAEIGCRYVPLSMDNKGTHPVRDLLLLWRFYRLLRRERPAVFLGYTVKPNVYGSLAAHTLDIPVVNNITGLGAVFIRNTWLTHVVRGLYRLALARSARVFFQNEDDQRFFLKSGIVPPEVTDRVPGSGVDLKRFSIAVVPDFAPDSCLLSEGNMQYDISSRPSPPAREEGKIRFLLIGRMLWDKGVKEYVAAARRVRQHYLKAEFCLLGFLDVQNPAAISRQQMQSWVEEGVVNYLGVSDDVRTYIATADCVVLPSYREGTARILLEAAAMGRPIITTDTVGCREVVEDGVNGFLCQVKNVDDLAKKLIQIIELSPEARVEMGRRGREKMEREFDEQIVIQKYLDAIRAVAG